MEYIKENYTLVVTTLTLLSHIVFICLAVLTIANANFRLRLYNFVNRNVLVLLFVVSLGAIIGSLSYSNIVGFVPCELCWVQRIFMYPQAIITFLALLKKDKSIVGYLLPLSILGSLVALFHSFVHWGYGTGLLGCTVVGGECAKIYVHAYGYITIPFMSFTTFIYLIAISLIYNKSKNERESYNSHP